MDADLPWRGRIMQLPSHSGWRATLGHSCSELPDRDARLVWEIGILRAVGKESLEGASFAPPRSMATLHKNIFIAARPEQVWDAVRDIGALHTRLVPGFVLDTRVEGDTRVVTFANGRVVREPIRGRPCRTSGAPRAAAPNCACLPGGQQRTIPS